MTSLVQAVRQDSALKKFHNDERGMQSIETVVLLAIAAVVVVGIFWLWDKADVGGDEGGVKGAIATLLTDLFDEATTWVSDWFA